MTRELFEHLFVGNAVHCATEEKAKAFLKLADGFGYRWRSSDSLLEEDCWSIYQEETCYSIKDGQVGYCTVEWFKEQSYSVVEFDDVYGFDVKESQKETRGDTFNESLKNALLSYAWDMKNVIIEEDYKGKKFIIYDRASMFDPKTLVDDDGYFTDEIDKLEVLNVFMNDSTLYIIVKENA